MSPIFWGVSNFSEGLQFFEGGLQFGGGEGGQLRGDPQFFGGGNFFLISAFFGDTAPPPSKNLSWVVTALNGHFLSTEHMRSFFQ